MAETWPRSVSEITPAWLSWALGQRYPNVCVRDAEIVNTMGGFATKVRVRLTYQVAGGGCGLPAMVIVKGNFNLHGLGTDHRAAALIEMISYRDVVPHMVGVNTPRCHFAGEDPASGECILILEDLALREVTFCNAHTQISYDQACRFLDQDARIHASWWDHAELKEGRRFGPESPLLRAHERLARDYLGPLLQPEYWRSVVSDPHGRAIARCLTDLGHMVSGLNKLDQLISDGPFTLTRGDDHLGNLFMEKDGTPGCYDWHVKRVPWWLSVAYFLIPALDIADRRAWDRSLLTYYLGRLQAHGVPNIPNFDEAWLAFRAAAIFPLFVWITTPAAFHAESLLTTNAARAGAAALDYDTLSLLGVSHRGQN